MKLRTTVSVLLIVLLVALATCTGSLALAQQEDLSRQLQRLARKARIRDYGDLWEVSRDIASLGQEALDPLEELLPNAGAKERLAFDAAFFELGKKALASEDLISLVANEKIDVGARVAAVNLLQDWGSRRDLRKLYENVAKYTEPLVRIAVCRAGFAKLREVGAARILRDYVASADYNVRAEAAVALAQVDDFASSKQVLREITKEPTRRGELARSLLTQDALAQIAIYSQGLKKDELVKAKDEKIEELKVEVAKLKREKKEATRAGNNLLDELIKRIQYFYVDESKIDPSNLIDAAAKGMIGSLDRYSSYMDARETKLFKERMQQNYSGIGAVVSKKQDDYLLIESPIYSGPAYRVGLRSGDKIIKVNDRDIRRLSIDEVVDKLKGKEGTPVKISVRRAGWRKDRDYTIMRESINMPSVSYTMLPAKIGYIAFTSFGQEAVEEVEKALSTLERQGMKALIFDVRYNPGGYLEKAVQIADKFLKGGKLIVSSKGRNAFIAPEQKFYSHDAGTHPDFPMLVLINMASASASEILAGCMKDHKRATVIGQTTFGKGSVQQLFPIQATGGKTRLRLTIAKYYLPSGRSIHREEGSKEGGVKPDIEVKILEIPLDQYDDAEKLDKDKVFDKYLDKYYKDNRELFHSLSACDRADHTRYPHFERWYRSLNTRLEKDYVRMFLRREVRQRVSDDLGKRLIADYSDDNVLQRSIIEALKILELDPHRIPDYKFFADNFKEEKKDKPKTK